MSCVARRATCRAVSHRLDDVKHDVLDGIAGRHLPLARPRVDEPAVHARPVGQRALEILADVVVQPDRAARQVQLDQPEVVEALRQMPAPASRSAPTACRAR